MPGKGTEAHLVNHGDDGDGQVDLEAVDDGHPGAAEQREDQAPPAFCGTTFATC